MPKVLDPHTAGIHIVGATSTGITKKVAQALAREIKVAYRQRGKQVRLKGMRFIPSSRVDLGNGRFEVLASTVVEVAGQGGRPNRSEAIESVLTIGREHSGQVLTSVKTPALERAEYFSTATAVAS